MFNKRKHRYFIAIVLPAAYAEKVHQLQTDFQQLFHSKAALQSPPHITLHMPFEWRADKEKKLIDNLADFFSSRQPPQVHLQNFGCFPPRVLFIDVLKTEDLDKLQKELARFCRIGLNLFNANHSDNPFYPHVTISFRDLKRPAFYEAWKEFSEKKLAGSFTANFVSLLKRTDKRWEVHHQFALNQSA